MIATSIEQSKKLVELDIDTSTADMSWASNGFGQPFLRTLPIKGHPEELSPAWSLSALLEIIRNHDRHELYLYEGGYYFECGEFMTESYFNPIDAAFEMVCWLKENKYI